MPTTRASEPTMEPPVYEEGGVVYAGKIIVFSRQNQQILQQEDTILSEAIAFHEEWFDEVALALAGMKAANVHYTEAPNTSLERIYNGGDVLKFLFEKANLWESPPIDNLYPIPSHQHHFGNIKNKNAIGCLQGLLEEMKLAIPEKKQKKPQDWTEKEREIFAGTAALNGIIAAWTSRYLPITTALEELAIARYKRRIADQLLSAETRRRARTRLKLASVPTLSAFHAPAP